ncbi:T9SS type A sorting domain-containing protein [Lewinella sp. W8]|uniref:T9SS type A sorting domain-containing protein n=1 Tax=Lewinella sp. W8 TaxID=2528208 RepID=UPI001067E85E|nr:T9SS type A sorting domain-containing protein [Lewinella sp. W8]MTB50056.1 T9SS type A sorting domain-containing protein [Lewinella sp. W8]
MLAFFLRSLLAITIYLTITPTLASQSVITFHYDQHGNMIRQDVPCQQSPPPQFARVELFPNPTAGVTYLSYDQLRPGKVTLGLVDATGRELWRAVTEVAPGSQRHRLAIDHLPPGIYFLYLRQIGGIEQRKLVIL